jgi:hypothetical protein
MSLTVPPELLEQAKEGRVDPAAFIDCVRNSLPYAWSLISDLVKRLEHSGAAFVDNQVAPASAQEYGQLFRALSSTAIREAMEEHFGVRLAFQNCHRVAVFAPSAKNEYNAFTTPIAQLLNQTPDLINC